MAESRRNEASADVFDPGGQGADRAESPEK